MSAFVHFSLCAAVGAGAAYYCHTDLLRLLDARAKTGRWLEKTKPTVKPNPVRCARRACSSPPACMRRLPWQPVYSGDVVSPLQESMLYTRVRRAAPALSCFGAS